MIYENFLTADRTFEEDDKILDLGATPCHPEDPRRIQISETKFILPPVLLYHSCEPNAYIDWNLMKLKALKNIQKDECITYHYGTSEYDYTVGAFRCECGSIACLQYFKGFKYMTKGQQRKIYLLLAPYLKDIFDANS